MQYTHWLMVAGVVLVVLGFIGLALFKNDAKPPAEGHLMRDTSSETIQAALALQLCFLWISESMGNHDSNVVGTGRIC